MISAEIRQEVFSRLRAAESEHHAKVLLAIESGSRAWGFASPNRALMNFKWVAQREG